jgi:hypothetical protein
MLTRHLALLVGSALVATIGCEPLSSIPEGRDDAVRYQLPPNAPQILERAQVLEILALGEPDDVPERDRGRFDGRPILGRARLGAEQRGWVARAIYQAIGGGSGAALCFSPHHGVRAQLGDETLELSICYGCVQLKVLGAERGFIAIDPAPLRATLDAVLRERAYLEFAEGPDEPFGRWTAIEPDRARVDVS